MAKNMLAANTTVDLALRALQLIFAIIIMGTAGYAIHTFRSYTVYTETNFGDFYSTYDVPDAWGFLMFCAGWTLLVVIFVLAAGIRFPNHARMGYIRVAAETIALLSWLAGFVAVAVNIGNEGCPTGNNSCGPLKAATVFGAFEWLLFVVTSVPTIMLVFQSTRGPKTSPAMTQGSPAAVV